MTRINQDWDVFYSSNDDRHHVIPRFDNRPHDPLKNCWCNPHRDKELYIHHAADGRDAFQIKGTNE